MKRTSLIKWTDISDKEFKAVKVRFLNSLTLVIVQKHNELEFKHLWHVTVLKQDGSKMENFLDPCDVYSNELDKDFTALLTLKQVEYYVNKLSKFLRCDLK